MIGHEASTARYGARTRADGYVDRWMHPCMNREHSETDERKGSVLMMKQSEVK